MSRINICYCKTGSPTFYTSYIPRDSLVGMDLEIYDSCSPEQPLLAKLHLTKEDLESSREYINEILNSRDENK